MYENSEKSNFFLFAVHSYNYSSSNVIGLCTKGLCVERGPKSPPGLALPFVLPVETGISKNQTASSGSSAHSPILPNNSSNVNFPSDRKAEPSNLVVHSGSSTSDVVQKGDRDLSYPPDPNNASST